jgi:hypothetical protein
MEMKRISYYYDGEFREEDAVIDPDGTAAVPEKGAVIRMHGQNWRVTHIAKSLEAKDDYTVYKLYLARA